MNTNYATVQSAPSAYITKNKQRIKQNSDTVYLQNGDTFEIELYNPTQDDILAKIDLNQKSISGGGIVLRPGERVFLERYLDDAKKFKFETYEVDDSFESELATMKNGWVTVTFHKEQIYQPNYPSGTIIYNNTNPWGNVHTYYNHTGNPTFIGTTTTDGLEFNTTGMNNASANFVDMGNQFNPSSVLRSSAKAEKVETGKIEKGAASKQKFTNVNKEFNTFPFATVNWKILPKSRQPLTSGDLNKRYCTDCGAKIKKPTFKFCPHCGTKVD
jgi:hypothetical protein